MALVKAAFPEYSFDEIEEWPWSRLIDMVSKAETVLELQGLEISLINNLDELQEQKNEKLSEDTEFILELRASGIDPMVYFKDEIEFKEEYSDFPLIGGRHWDNEDVLYAIRRQMEKAVKRRT